jgi:hypothetical protein
VESSHRNGDIVPPVGEQIHLPGPSYLPALVAVGLTLGIVGVVISQIVVMVGVLIVAVATFLWVREAREELADLPLPPGE